MERISSNWTLFYKLFLPTFWIAFFGAVTAASLLAPYAYVGDIPRRSFQAGVIFVFLSGTAALLFTLMRLKRVELGADSVYVTNYFSHYRYTYGSIEKLEVGHFLMLRPATLHLRQAGHFGRRITFLLLPDRLREFLRTHPELKGRLTVEGLKA